MPDRSRPRARGTAVYAKPALAEGDLLARWTSRGLVVGDRERALRALRHIGYYRLSAYVRSFEDAQRPSLRPGTTLEDVLELYDFDRELRLVVLDALERIEIAVRAAIGDEMSRRAGPHWYEDPSQFVSPDIQERLLRDVDGLVKEQLRRRPEVPTGEDAFVSALEHYVTQYRHPQRPPSWLVFEELTFGSLTNVYAALADGSAQRNIATSLGLMPPVLSSWLRTYQRVRNICAHHGRLWNRGLGVYPAIPTSPRIRWLTDRDLFARDTWRRLRLYPVLVSLQAMSYAVAPETTWASRLVDTFGRHPTVPLSPMGVPGEWLTDPFWWEAAR